MNTEPVKTTMRGIAAFIAGAAALTQALIMVINETLRAVGMDPIPDALGSAIVTLVTVAVGIYSNVIGADRLREKVTPWSADIGAMTPAPEVAGDSVPGALEDEADPGEDVRG